MDLQSEMNAFIIHREALCNSSFEYTFLNLQDYYSITRPTHTEVSNVVYLHVEVIDAVVKTP